MLKVSVIIPAHNSSAFIEIAINSVLSQTMRDVEVIVTDDGSSDDTSAVVRRAAAKDDRIKLLRHDLARGPAAARNTAIRAAQGDWLAPLDSDDEFSCERLARLVALAEARNLDFVADNLLLADFESRRHLGLAFPPEWMERDALVELDWVLQHDWPGQTHSPFGFVQPLMKRSFLERNGLRYDEDIFGGEDLLLYCKALLAGARFGVTNEAMYIYYMRNESISKTPEISRHLYQVNNHVRIEVESSARELKRILRRRGDALQYEVFSYTWKQGKLLSALRSGARISPGYFSQRIGSSAMKQLLKRLPSPQTRPQGVAQT